MNFVEMILNYLDFYKIIIIFTVILIIFVSFLLLSSDFSILSDVSLLNYKKLKNNLFFIDKKSKKEERTNDLDRTKYKQNIKFRIKEFYQNEIDDNSDRFILFNKTENITLSKIMSNNENKLNTKNEELSKMFIESISSLNSWKTNNIENELFKKINWGLEKRENNNDEDESLVLHYVSPIFKENEFKSSNNLSSSQISINSNSETDDEEEL